MLFSFSRVQCPYNGKEILLGYCGGNVGVGERHYLQQVKSLESLKGVGQYFALLAAWEVDIRKDKDHGGPTREGPTPVNKYCNCTFFLGHGWEILYNSFSYLILFSFIHFFLFFLMITFLKRVSCMIYFRVQGSDCNSCNTN